MMEAFISPTQTAPSLPARSRAAITVRGVTKFSGGSPLYGNFNLNIPQYRIICSFGPNGCGKSILINLIAGLVPIDGGEILSRQKKMFPRVDMVRNRLVGTYAPLLATSPRKDIP